MPDSPLRLLDTFVNDRTIFNTSPVFIEYQDVLQRVVENLVSRFSLGSAPTMLAAMEQSDSVISGSAGVAVLFREDFIPNDIDFYVPRLKASILISFLESFGYRRVDEGVEFGYASQSGIWSVFRYIIEAEASCSPSINVILVSGLNPFRPITSFDSTIVMNFIAHYGLVCLYPEMTLLRMGLALDEGTGHRDLWMARYRQRGFRFSYDYTFPEHAKYFVRRTLSNDDGLLFLPFPGEGCELSSHLISDHTWTLCVNSDADIPVTM